MSGLLAGLFCQCSFSLEKKYMTRVVNVLGRELKFKWREITIGLQLVVVFLFIIVNPTCCLAKNKFCLFLIFLLKDYIIISTVIGNIVLIQWYTLANVNSSRKKFKYWGMFDSKVRFIKIFEFVIIIITIYNITKSLMNPQIFLSKR